MSRRSAGQQTIKLQIEYAPPSDVSRMAPVLRKMNPPPKTAKY